MINITLTYTPRSKKYVCTVLGLSVFDSTSSEQWYGDIQTATASLSNYLLLRIHKSTMIRYNSHNFMWQTILVRYNKEPTVTQPCALQVGLTSKRLKRFKPRATDQIAAGFIQKRMWTVTLSVHKLCNYISNKNCVITERNTRSHIPPDHNP